jgi:hypothetical protein
MFLRKTKPTVWGKAVAFVLATAWLVPGVAAQQEFGTVVRVGDSDYAPITKAASIAVSVNEADLDNPGVARDNCLLLDTGPLNGGAFADGAHFGDLRLTSCMGRAPGTSLGDGDPVERSIAYTNVPDANTQYADLNGNGKYDRGEYVYLTTSPAGSLATTGATGTWTIRLTSTPDKAAGSFAFNGDSDFNAWKASTKSQAFSVVQREDKAWYLVPMTAGFAKGSLIPEKSIRLQPAKALRPDVLVSKVEAANTTVREGEPLALRVGLENKGTGAGVGLVLVRVDGQILDAQLSPWLLSGEKTTVDMGVKAPAPAGNHTLRIGGHSVEVQVIGPAQQPDAAALWETIALLEDRIKALEASRKESAIAAQAVEVKTEGPVSTPAPDFALVLALLALVFVSWKRRRI